MTTLEMTRKAHETSLADKKARMDRLLVVTKLLANTVGYLYSRWQDEKEYEDFAEYSVHMEKALAAAAPELKFVKATKRPFGLRFEFEGRVAFVKATSRSISYGFVS